MKEKRVRRGDLKEGQVFDHGDGEKYVVVKCSYWEVAHVSLKDWRVRTCSANTEVYLVEDL